jgi:predicted phage terminase large subunit-like protein
MNFDNQQQREEILKRWEKAKEWRQMARTNLLFLCRELLGYRDVSKEVHGEILAHLQKFTGGTDKTDEKGIVTYTPFIALAELEGSRNNLILFPRGHFKTSIITIAHTIQWIINYPDIRVALSMAIGDQTQKVMKELKGHFQYNPMFRKYFADYCPAAKKVNDWGNMEEFTVQNRRKFRKEPTVCLITIGKVIAGSHYDVIKHSDLVDENNVKTPNQINDVISHFGHMDPLLERYSSDDPNKPRQAWQDVEGTRYDFGDLYGILLGSNEYKSLVRGVYKKDGTTIDMKRFPPAEMDRIKRKPEITPYIFSCQYENKPIPPDGGLCDPKDIVFLPRQIIRDLQPMLRLHCTVDLHGLEPSTADADYTVLNVHGFDRDGRLYIVDVRRGRFTPSEFVWHFFDIASRYHALIDFKVEKVILWAALKATLQAEMEKRRKYASIMEIKRDNRTSKQQRIRGLQAWFKTGRIRFADDLTCKIDIMQEIMQFPSQSSGVHDDILDTCADAIQGEDGETNVDVLPAPDFDARQMFGLAKPTDRFLGFGVNGEELWLYGDNKTEVKSPTGVL